MNGAKRLAGAAAAAICASGIFVAPAYAGRPVGGCGKGLERVTIAQVQELAEETPDDVIAGFDVNGDGLLCRKLLPAVPGDSVRGTAVDNTTQQKRN